MSQVRSYDFKEQLVWSDGFLKEGILQILRARIPGCTEVEKACNEDDRNGTDYWIKREGLRPLSIDVKVRDVDWSARGKDDLALETWSVIDIKPGWTRDKSKETDYILWFWQDSGRFFLCAFPPLCETFRRYWQSWREQFKVATQDSGSWQSECVFVPRQLVIDKLSSWQNGVINNQE